jgi:hypothetical protein
VISAAPPACFHGEQVSPEDLPPWEPDDDTHIDPDHLPPDDPVWAEFYGKPFVLPV